MLENSLSKTRCDRDRGVALFAAIWVVLIVTALALGVGRQTQVTTQIAGHALASARAAAAADAGLTWIAFGLGAEARGLPLPTHGTFGSASAFRPAQRLRMDGRAYAWRHGDADVTLQVQAESGKFDLNTGAMRWLVPALEKIAPEHAQAVASAIRSARRRDARGGRISWRMDTGSLARVSDLGRMPGVTPRLYRQLEPLLTVHGRTAAPDPLTAPEALFAELPLEDDRRRQLAAARADGTNLPRQRAVSTISAQARLADGTTARAAALIETTPSGPRPYRVLERLHLHPAMPRPQ